jgi:hypothetical protein
MNMRADIYVQQNTQSKSGAIERQWVYYKTIDCRVEPLKTGNSMGRSDNKAFDVGGPSNDYIERFQLKLKSSELLSRRWRVSSIRGNDGDVIYKEIDKYDQPDMIFDVGSSHAEIDPFGRVNYYETSIQRVLVQQNDTNSSN